MRVLLIEDDVALGEGLQRALKQQGYAVDWLRDGAMANAMLEAEHFDLCLLDLGLPKRDGLEILRRARREGQQLPVLILTARDAIEDRVTGLDAGADDYLTKPFDLDELGARMRSLLRRRGGRAEATISHGDIVVDVAARSVMAAGRDVPLSTREFAVLHALLDRCGQVLTRDRLEQAVYAFDEQIESNTLEVYIHHLRKKLGSDLIRTVRGVGYVIDRLPS